jgi:hypothetical protein
MALVGLKRASELTGKNQSTIHRAMKAGRLSFTVSEGGERLIDTSELHRVFPIQVEDTQARKDAPEGQSNDTQLNELRLELELKRQKVSMLEVRVAELEEIKADLRQDRDKWRAQAEHNIRLLIDQREKQEPAPTEKPKKGLFSRLFGG